MARAALRSRSPTPPRRCAARSLRREAFPVRRRRSPRRTVPGAGQGWRSGAVRWRAGQAGGRAALTPPGSRGRGAWPAHSAGPGPAGQRVLVLSAASPRSQVPGRSPAAEGCPGAAAAAMIRESGAVSPRRTGRPPGQGQAFRGPGAVHRPASPAGCADAVAGPRDHCFSECRRGAGLAARWHVSQPVCACLAAAGPRNRTPCRRSGLLPLRPLSGASRPGPVPVAACTCILPAGLL
jgi:hypothetical protein